MSRHTASQNLIKIHLQITTFE